MFYIKKSIKKSKNLKGLILRLNNQNISYYISLIEDLKKENNKIMNYKKQEYKDTYLYKNEKEEVKKYIEIYLNDKKIEYKFKETREYEILIKIKRPLRVIYFLIDLL